MSQEIQKHSESNHGNRHRSRVLALQTLYACEVGMTTEWQAMLSRVAEGNRLSGNVVRYAYNLLAVLYPSTAMIDELIRECAANWDIKRMAVIDRNIIRLAVTELRAFHQVPAKVVIDEAVELAKAYGAEDSGKFVNGIIDSIHKNILEITSVSGKEGSVHGTDTCPL